MRMQSFRFALPVLFSVGCNGNVAMEDLAIELVQGPPVMSNKKVEYLPIEVTKDKFVPELKEKKRCKSNLAWLERVAGPEGRVPKAGSDALFPRNARSIYGQRWCGWTTQKDACDTVGGGAKAWRRMKDIRKDAVVWNHLNYNDLAQKSLNTCYFLSSLIAIAKVNKDVIKNVFFDKSKWDKGVYPTRWTINGFPMEVEVDDYFLDSSTGFVLRSPIVKDQAGNVIPFNQISPEFTQPSKEGEYWVPLLEKSYAKIFGGYAFLSMGSPLDAMGALTGAVCRRQKHDDDDYEGLYADLNWAASRKFPIIAGCCNPKSKFIKAGLMNMHMYAVLGVGDAPYKDDHHGGHEKGVHIMNPGHFDTYKGKWGDHNTNKDDGEFWMPVDEFYEHFVESAFCMIIDGKHSKHVKVDVDHKKDDWASRIKKLATIDVPKKGRIYTAVVWPEERSCPKMDVCIDQLKTRESTLQDGDGCYTTSYLEVAKEGDAKPLKLQRLNKCKSDRYWTATVYFVDVEPGKYNLSSWAIDNEEDLVWNPTIGWPLSKEKDFYQADKIAATYFVDMGSDDSKDQIDISDFLKW